MKLRNFISIAMLASIAYVLMFIKFPMLPGYSYLTIDFSDIPALIGALIFGPVAAVLIEVIKNVLDYIVRGSEVGIPIGNVSNILAGLIFILPTYWVYRFYHTKLGMLLGLISGTVALTILMSVLNYFVILPAYLMLLHFDVGNVKQYIFYGILPFNLIKGSLVTVLFLLLFLKMHRWIEKKSQFNNVKI